MVSELSQVLIHESSDIADHLSSSSEDGQGAVLDLIKEKSIKRLITSKSKTDQRFIDMFRVEQARKYGVKIGFKGLRKQTR